MNGFSQMPIAPAPYQQNAYDAYGNPIQAQVYPPQQQYYQQPYMAQQPAPPYYQQPAQAVVQPAPNGLGANFSGLINTNISVPIERELPSQTKKTARRRTTKKADSDSTELTVIDPKEEIIAAVETVDYEATYEYTSGLLKGTIGQIDILTSEMKQELDKLRSSNTVKGKYTYIPNLVGAISGLMGNKIAAARELNSSIKSANEAEYRRYKDNRATMQSDDNKAIMDLYNAYIHTPLGTYGNQDYYQPSTLDLTSGINGMVRVDTAPPAVRDAGFQGFMGNLTPEQNMMINEGNPNIEEVIVYDQSNGKKYFEWRDLSTGKSVPNMPVTDAMFMEDFTIDPRTRTAKNTNLNMSMKVIYQNEGQFGEY